MTSNIATIRKFRDALGFDNTTAIRFLKWQDALYRAKLLKAPAYQFKVQRAGTRTFIVISHVVAVSETDVRLGCAHCGKPSDVSGVKAFPHEGFKVWHPKDENIPQALRLAGPTFLLCVECVPKLAAKGVFEAALGHKAPASKEGEVTS